MTNMETTIKRKNIDLPVDVLQKLSLMAEASMPGTKDYNQSLSERRLQHVVDALVKEGFSRKAAGESPAADGSL